MKETRAEIPRKVSLQAELWEGEDMRVPGAARPVTQFLHQQRTNRSRRPTEVRGRREMKYFTSIYSDEPGVLDLSLDLSLDPSLTLSSGIQSLSRSRMISEWE